MTALRELGHALWLAFAMFWEILWPLILGFTISGVVQAVVSKKEMARLLGDDRPATLAKACGLGAALAPTSRGKTPPDFAIELYFRHAHNPASDCRLR